MKKSIKKVLSVVMCSALLFAIAPVRAFASEANPVTSNLTVENYCVTGDINLSNVVQVKNNGITNKDGKEIFSGSIGGEVSSKDLFESAYNKYLTDVKDKKIFVFPTFKNLRELVMFDYKEHFPTCTFKVKLPSNFVIDNITTDVNSTEMFSKVAHSIDTDTNEITFVFNLGNWDDYQGFFARYEREKDDPSHKTIVNIDYHVDVTGNSNTSLGYITASGYCKLYKGGRINKNKQLVDITATEISKPVIR